MRGGGSGFRLQDLVIDFEGLGWVWGSWLDIQGLGFRLQGSEGSGFRVSGLGVRGSGFGCKPVSVLVSPLPPLRKTLPRDAIDGQCVSV